MGFVTLVGLVALVGLLALVGLVALLVFSPVVSDWSGSPGRSGGYFGPDRSCGPIGSCGPSGSCGPGGSYCLVAFIGLMALVGLVALVANCTRRKSCFGDVIKQSGYLVLFELDGILFGLH